MTAAHWSIRPSQRHFSIHRNRWCVVHSGSVQEASSCIYLTELRPPFPSHYRNCSHFCNWLAVEDKTLWTSSDRAPHLSPSANCSMASLVVELASIGVAESAALTQLARSELRQE